MPRGIKDGAVKKMADTGLSVPTEVWEELKSRIESALVGGVHGSTHSATISLID
jgi:hypothetical protein